MGAAARGRQEVNRMKRELCELISNYPTVTILGLTVLAVLCLFSILGTVCFLGVFCLLMLSVQKGQKEGWLREEEPRPRRRPRRRRPEPRRRAERRQPPRPAGSRR